MEVASHPRHRDMSQPSLGPDEHQNDRLATPPLSPLYLVDGSSHVPSKPSKMQISCYQKPASLATASMETHWEEVVHPDNKQQPIQQPAIKAQEVSGETDETESELIAIPESDLSDSTLYDSNQVT